MDNQKKYVDMETDTVRGAACNPLSEHLSETERSDEPGAKLMKFCSDDGILDQGGSSPETLQKQVDDEKRMKAMLDEEEAIVSEEMKQCQQQIQQLMCPACKQSEVEMVLQPCGDTTCKGCADQAKCPSCGGNVEERIEFIMA